MAINEAMAPGEVIILEGEVTDSAMVSTNVLVVGGDTLQDPLGCINTISHNFMTYSNYVQKPSNARALRTHEETARELERTGMCGPDTHTTVLQIRPSAEYLRDRGLRLREGGHSEKCCAFPSPQSHLGTTARPIVGPYTQSGECVRTSGLELTQAWRNEARPTGDVGAGP